MCDGSEFKIWRDTGSRDAANSIEPSAMMPDDRSILSYPMHFDTLASACVREYMDDWSMTDWGVSQFDAGDHPGISLRAAWDAWRAGWEEYATRYMTQAIRDRYDDILHPCPTCDRDVRDCGGCKPPRVDRCATR